MDVPSPYAKREFRNGMFCYRDSQAKLMSVVKAYFAANPGRALAETMAAWAIDNELWPDLAKRPPRPTASSPKSFCKSRCSMRRTPMNTGVMSQRTLLPSTTSTRRGDPLAGRYSNDDRPIKQLTLFEIHEPAEALEPKRSG